MKERIYSNHQKSFEKTELDVTIALYSIVSFYYNEYLNVFNSNFIKYHDSFTEDEESYVLQYKSKIAMCISNFEANLSIFIQYQKRYEHYCDIELNIRRQSGFAKASLINKKARDELEEARSNLLKKLVENNNEAEAIFKDIIDKIKRGINIIKNVKDELNLENDIYYNQNNLHGKTVQQSIIETYCLAITVKHFLETKKIEESLWEKIKS